MLLFRVLIITGVVLVLGVLILILRSKGAQLRGRRRDYNVKYLIFAAHGIRTRGDWMEQLFEDIRNEYSIYQNSYKTKFIPVRYGYVFASLCVIGFIRDYLINWMRKKLELYCDRFPAAKVVYIGHSYGTMLGYEALRRSDNIYLDKMILIAGIISSHEKFTDTIGMGKVKEIHCFCSKEDEVCKYNPFGHCGYWGFLRANDRKLYNKPYPELNIYNHLRENLEHSDYFQDKVTVKTINNILNPVYYTQELPSSKWLCPFMKSNENSLPVCVKEICKFYDEETEDCIFLKISKSGI